MKTYIMSNIKNGFKPKYEDYFTLKEGSNQTQEIKRLKEQIKLYEDKIFILEEIIKSLKAKLEPEKSSFWNELGRKIRL